MKYLVIISLLLCAACKSETIKLKYENTLVIDNRSDSIPAVLIGLHEMSAQNVMKLETVIHELLDETPVEARVAALIKSIDSKKGTVSIYSKTGKIYEFQSKDGFPIKGSWDNDMAIFESVIKKDNSKQGFSLEFSSMLILNKSISE
ncbi:hypothetical protein OAT71_02200 [Flavobacteriales bacterium]|nr:hypothetical protein [Flavobacteriales bacterium]